MTTLSYRDLAECAGLLAHQASHIIESDKPIAPSALYDLAALSRRRLKCWWAIVERAADHDVALSQRPQLLPLAEEILVSEIQVRVAAAILVARDARLGQTVAGPFARHVLLDHLQAKQSVLSTLLNGVQPLGALLRLNRLRRRTEHWIDMLLSNPLFGDSAAEFAIDRERMERFREEAGPTPSLTAQRLLVVGLRQAMPIGVVEDPLRARLHECLSRLLLSLLPAAAFGEHGQIRSPALRRIASGSSPDVAMSRRGKRHNLHRGHAVFEIVRRHYRASDASTDG